MTRNATWSERVDPMVVTKIEATRDQIRIHVSNADEQEVLVRETNPVIFEKPGSMISMTKVKVRQGILVLGRLNGPHDRLYSEFALFWENAQIGGVRYVTDVAADVPTNRLPYPQPVRIKALNANAQDVQTLGIQQATYNVNLPSLMAANPSAGTLEYHHDGRTYWFLQDRVLAIDEYLREQDRCGVLVTLILLNAPKHFQSTRDAVLLDACLHPGFDAESPNVFISAFDMRTADGQGYYRAFCEFLAERYTRNDQLYGRIAGFIIGNEVQSQYVWGNAGDLGVDEYTREYTQALRLAWLCGQKHCAYLRVYASLDHFWNQAFHNDQPLRYYSGRQVIDSINRHAVRDGDFPWHVAYHPYPEDLRWPDFWHDRSAEFTFDTARITFRNMEVLPAYLAQDALCYRGSPRRIIFSEQGFNSQSGPLQQMTEEMGEAGYVLAYLKARAMPTVDMLMHHAYLDNPHEFGLNLGIRRYDPEAPDHVGSTKPIYHAIRDMDTEQEPARIAKARAAIGPAIFGYLHHPPAPVAVPDRTSRSDFGTS